MKLKKEDSKLYDKLAVALLTGGDCVGSGKYVINYHNFILGLIQNKNEALKIGSNDEVKLKD